MLKRNLCAVLTVLLAAAVLAVGQARPSDPWTSTDGGLLTARGNACSVLLPDGRVLITGGAQSEAALGSTEFFGTDGRFTPAPAMLQARVDHACVLLPGGGMLVAGGRNGDNLLDTTEIFDAVTAQWRAGPPMPSARAGAAFATLADSRLLMAGGTIAGGLSNELVIFDPVSGSFSSLPVFLSSARKDHAMAVTQAGKVVIVGGFDGTNFVDSIELFDPIAVTITSVGKLSVPRSGLSATTLLDGRVAFVGGGNDAVELGITDTYDPKTGVITTEAAPMGQVRRGHSAVRVPYNNTVLLVGGTAAGQPLSQTEAYIPWRHEFRPSGTLDSGRTGAIALALPQEGKALVAGGAGRAGALASANTSCLPTIKADKTNYSPEQAITITGSCWQPGATLAIVMKQDPDDHGASPIALDPSVVQPDGTFSNATFAPKNNDVSATFYLTATAAGSASGAAVIQTAQISFNDVVAPPTVTLAYGAASIPLAGTTTLTYTVTNPNPGTALTGIVLADHLGTGTGSPGLNFVVSLPPYTCGGMGVMSITGSVYTANLHMAAGETCTITANVKGVAGGLQSNATDPLGSTESGPGTASNTATITVVPPNPPTVTIAYGAASIAMAGTTTLTYTVTNPNPGTALTGIVLTDHLGAGTTSPGLNFVVSLPPYTCGGMGVMSITGTAFSANMTMAAGESCTITATVKGIATGLQSNATDPIGSTESGPGTASNTATITVAGPGQPAVAIAYGAASIPMAGTTTLTFTVTNPNAGTALTGIVLADHLGAGTTSPGLNFVVSLPTYTCGGMGVMSITGTAFSANMTMAAGESCTITANVKGIATGLQSNATDPLGSTESGPGTASNIATITVTGPKQPTVTIAYGAASIVLGSTTTLRYTVTNPNAGTALTGIVLADHIGAGTTSPGLNFVVSLPTYTCGGMGVMSISGSAFSANMTMAAGESCTITANVKGVAAGLQSNATDPLGSTESGPGTASNIATITVVLPSPPTVTIAYGAASVVLGSTTTLRYTVTNPNAGTALTGIVLADHIGAGTTSPGLNFVVSLPTYTCGGMGVMSISGSAFSANMTMAAGESCTITANVKGVAAGLQSNATDPLGSTESGPGAASNTATITVVLPSPPTVTIAYGAASILMAGTTTLTYTVTNPNPGTALTGIVLADHIGAGTTSPGLNFVVSLPPYTCGGMGVMSITGTAFSANMTMAAGESCTITATVRGVAAGLQSNATDPIGSTESGPGTASNTATIAVAVPPVIAKAFGASSIALNGSTSLSFTITNPASNTISLTGVAFTDTLPAGLLVSTPNGLANSCGGTATATAGSGSVSLSSGTLAGNGSCTVSVNILGTTAGVKNNTTSAVTSTEGGTGGTASASLTVVAPPLILKAFGAASIPLNSSTSLAFTILNNNTATVLSGVSFTDTLPAGLVISTPNGLSGSCGGGTITGTQGANVISLSGATLAASASCTFSVNVTGIAAGQMNNMTGAVRSTEGGTGGTASASVIVEAPPVIAKAFSPTTVVPNSVSTLTFTITNPAVNTLAQTGLAFTDTLPAGLVVATPNGLSNSCGGTATATAGSGSITLTGGSLAVNTSCTILVNVTGPLPGLFTNTTGAVTSTNGGTGNTATATLRLAYPPNITKGFGAATIPLNTSTSLTFTIQNPNTVVITLSGIAFTDNLPAGLSVAPASVLMNSCGGTVTAVPGSGRVSLVGTSLAPNTSCAVTVAILGATAGVKTNSVQVTSMEGGVGNTSNATITVVSPPGISKAFGAASMLLNGSTTLTFTLQNSNATQSLSGISFGDSLPAGLAVATPNGLAGSCGAGTITATAGSAVIGLTGGTLATSTSCVFSVNVRGVRGGTQTNTTGVVSSTEGGNGSTATASIAVNPIGSTTTLAVPGTSHFGESVTLTATVGSTYGTPAGSVGFFDGATSLGSATLNSGTATLSTSSLTLGTHSITAQYQGSADYTSSTSTAMTQNVTTPLVTVNVGGGSSLTIPSGQTGTITFTVGSTGTLSSPVTFSCSGLPPGANCIFSPAAAGPTNLPVTVTLAITTTRLQVVGQNRGIGRYGLAFGALLPAMFLLAGSRRRRRLVGTIMVLLVLLTLVFGLGCGGAASGGITNGQQYTAPGTYPITVTATSAGAVTSVSNLTIVVTR